jgi:hypothetical protein
LANERGDFWAKILNFDLHRLLDLSFSVAIAFVLATLIGAERQ